MGDRTVNVKETGGRVTPGDLLPEDFLYFQAATGLWGLRYPVQAPGRYVDGIVPANGTDATNDLNFGTGECRDSTLLNAIIASAAFTKRADATWAVGTGNGMHPGGGATAWGAATFHLFILGKLGDPTAYDFGMDSSLTAANLIANAAVIAAGFTLYRRVASFITAGAAWPLFFAWEMGGGRLAIKYDVIQQEFTEDPGADGARTTKTLAYIPAGIAFEGRFIGALADSSAAAGSTALFTEPGQTDTAAGIPTCHLRIAGDLATSQKVSIAPVWLRTNTSKQICYDVTGRTVDHGLRLETEGYEDARAA